MIQVFRPVIDVEAALEMLRPVLESGWLGQGPMVEALELRMAEIVGQRYFVATSSCTAALQLAVHCLDLPAGAEAITTPITFIATNAALIYERLYPRFVDVEPLTGNLSPSAVESALEEEPRALMIVHLGGHLARIPDHLDIPIVEDCAHALGVRHGSPNTCCWSLHAVKNLPAGDGGGVSTNDPILAERLRRLRWFGIDKSTASRSAAGGYQPEYEIGELGFKAHMNDIAAAIALSGIDKLEEGNARRRAIAKRYREEIKVQHPTPSQGSHFQPIFFPDRDRVAAALRAEGIFPGMHYRRNDRYPAFAPVSANLAGADWYERHELTLPLHLALTDSDVDRIIDVVNRAV